MCGQQNGNDGNLFAFKKNHIFVRKISFILNIIFPFCIFYFSWSITPCLRDAVDRCFWNSLAKLPSDVRVPVCVTIYVSYVFAPRSCTVDINWNRNLLSMALMPYTTYLPCPGAVISRSITTERPVKKLTSGILKWHIFSAQYNHLCSPIFYLTYLT